MRFPRSTPNLLTGASIALALCAVGCAADLQRDEAWAIGLGSLSMLLQGIAYRLWWSRPTAREPDRSRLGIEAP